MILVGNQRGGGKDLAQHLMKQDNEHVELYQVRGFVARDVAGAFNEAHAISRGTRCKQYLFSLSLNPPKEAEVSNQQFEEAVDQAETKLGLNGQPRVIVFHEKYGDDGRIRRHAHAVWSRIDGEEMKAVSLPHSKRKLQDVARDLHLEHGWQMPRGLANKGDRDPRNFSLEEWQQAKRINQDPREIKATFQEAWAISDSKASLSHALQERGYWLCRGDKRGYVALDVHGEVHNIAKRVGIKTKEVKDRLGDKDALPSVAETQRDLASAMRQKMEDFKREVAAKDAEQKRQAEIKKQALRERQKQQSEATQKAMAERQTKEQETREKRLRTGVMGLWDRVSGQRKRTLDQNQKEASAHQSRDLKTATQLKTRHETQQSHIEKQRQRERIQNQATTHSLTTDAKVFQSMETKAQQDLQERKEAFKQRRRRPSTNRTRTTPHSRDGPSR